MFHWITEGSKGREMFSCNLNICEWGGVDEGRFGYHDKVWWLKWIRILLQIGFEEFCLWEVEGIEANLLFATSNIEDWNSSSLSFCKTLIGIWVATLTRNRWWISFESSLNSIDSVTTPNNSQTPERTFKTCERLNNFAFISTRTNLSQWHGELGGQVIKNSPRITSPHEPSAIARKCHVTWLL